MRFVIKEQFFIPVILGFMLVGGFLFQDSLYLRSDVSNLLHSTRQLLNGGQYAKDFFMPNPPMILYLYSWPTMISQWLGINIILIFRIYVFFLASFSLLLIASILEHIFTEKDVKFKHIFLMAIAGIFFFLPVNEFGQREHFIIILSMPYLLNMVCFLSGKINNRWLRCLYGFMAGIGFVIKPQFMLVPVLIESYGLLKTKEWKTLFRLEVSIMMATMVLYMASIFIYHADFIFIILPYLMHFYYSCIGQPFLDLLFYPLALFCWINFPIYWLQYKNNPYQRLHTVFMVALTGFLGAFYLQHTISFYHLIPALGVGILSLILSVFLLTLNYQKSINQYFLLLFASANFFIFKFFFGLWFFVIIKPTLFFIFIFTVFFSTSYLICFRNILKPIIYGLFIVGVTSRFSFFVQHTDFYQHTFLLDCLLLSGFYLLLTTNAPLPKIKKIIILIYSIIVFCFPITYLSYQYDFAKSFDITVIDPLINFMRTQPKHEILYSISMDSVDIYPLIDYTDNDSLSVIDCLWMANELAKKRAFEGDNTLRQYIKYNRDQYFFINLIAKDINKKRPNLIIIDNSKYNARALLTPTHFDFLSYFLENPQFREEWKHYQYLTSLNFTNEYSVLIYKRS